MVIMSFLLSHCFMRLNCFWPSTRISSLIHLLHMLAGVGRWFFFFLSLSIFFLPLSSTFSISLLLSSSRMYIFISALPVPALTSAPSWVCHSYLIIDIYGNDGQAIWFPEYKACRNTFNSWGYKDVTPYLCVCFISRDCVSYFIVTFERFHSFALFLFF